MGVVFVHAWEGRVDDNLMAMISPYGRVNCLTPTKLSRKGLRRQKKGGEGREEDKKSKYLVDMGLELVALN